MHLGHPYNSAPQFDKGTSTAVSAFCPEPPPSVHRAEGTDSSTSPRMNVKLEEPKLGKGKTILKLAGDWKNSFMCQNAI